MITQTESLSRHGDYLTLRRQGRCVEITYDRGDGRNALSLQGMRELKQIAQILAEDTESSVIILRGEGVFSAGADLKDPERVSQGQASFIALRQAARLGPDMCQAWAGLEQITIVAIEGFCIGGGLALAAACDHRIAAEDSHMRLPEVPLGMNMSWQSVPRLVALIGPSRAKQLVILGQKVPAQTAYEWGLVDEVVSTGATLQAARALADLYAALPPVALRMAKQGIEAAAHPLSHATSFMDRDQFLLASKTRDQAEALTAFLEKRTPHFTGD